MTEVCEIVPLGVVEMSTVNAPPVRRVTVTFEPCAFAAKPEMPEMALARFCATTVGSVLPAAATAVLRLPLSVRCACHWSPDAVVTVTVTSCAVPVVALPDAATEIVPRNAVERETVRTAPLWLTVKPELASAVARSVASCEPDVVAVTGLDAYATVPLSSDSVTVHCSPAGIVVGIVNCSCVHGTSPVWLVAEVPEMVAYPWLSTMPETLTVTGTPVRPVNVSFDPLRVTVRPDRCVRKSSAITSRVVLPAPTR